MNQASRKIWKSPAGNSLFAAIFDRQPLKPQQKQTVQELKWVDQPQIKQPKT